MHVRCASSHVSRACARADAQLLAAVAPSDLAPKETFAPGDVVKVREGDLRNIVGIVQSVSAASLGGSVLVLPTSTALLGSAAELFKKGGPRGAPRTTTTRTHGAHAHASQCTVRAPCTTARATAWRARACSRRQASPSMYGMYGMYGMYDMYDMARACSRRQASPSSPSSCRSGSRWATT